MCPGESANQSISSVKPQVFENKFDFKPKRSSVLRQDSSFLCPPVGRNHLKNAHRNSTLLNNEVLNSLDNFSVVIEAKKRRNNVSAELTPRNRFHKKIILRNRKLSSNSKHQRQANLLNFSTAMSQDTKP